MYHSWWTPSPPAYRVYIQSVIRIAECASVLTRRSQGFAGLQGVAKICSNWFKTSESTRFALFLNIRYI